MWENHRFSPHHPLTLTPPYSLGVPMRALVLTRQGSPVAPNVEFRADYPDLSPPGPGQARIRTLASAFNHMDLWIGKGIGGLTLMYPRVGGCDACGIVEAGGPGVDATWVGRKVVVNAATVAAGKCLPDDPPDSSLAPAYELVGEHSDGMHREAFLAPVANLATVAQDADPAAVAAFGLVSLTAWSMIVTKAKLHPGQRVLITGIGGGVALAALAICKHFGCPIAVTSRHAWKLEKAKALGAELCVWDQGQDWSREVRGWSGKRGVDVAVDSSGKATHLNCIKSLARGGAYVTPGCTSGADATTDLARIFWNQLRLFGSTMGDNNEFREVVALFRSGGISVPVDKVYRAEQGREAIARLEAGEQFGKIVLTW